MVGSRAANDEFFSFLRDNKAKCVYELTIEVLNEAPGQLPMVGPINCSGIGELPRGGSRNLNLPALD